MKMITIKDVSRFSGENKETLKKKCQAGKIVGAIKVANVWMIPRSYVSGNQMQFAGVYIDGANILHGAIASDTKIDYGKVLKFVMRAYNISIASFYDSLGYEIDEERNFVRDSVGNKIPKEAQIKFFNLLKGLGFRVVSKPLKYIHGDITKPKNNMDVPLSLDALKEAGNWETLILFSGDSDYERLVLDVVAEKKNVKIFSFKNRLAYELRELAINNPRVTTTEIDDLKGIFQLSD